MIDSECSSNDKLARRSVELFRELLHVRHVQTDRLFAGLMFMQWLIVIAAACLSLKHGAGGHVADYSPLWLAVLLGGAVGVTPAALALLRPGAGSTRLTMAVAQLMTSVLLIHITDGRVGTTFHVFGSLSLLAFYCDSSLLVVASIIFAADQTIGGVFMHHSVHASATAGMGWSVWHLAWIVVEDACLFPWIGYQRRGMQLASTRQAELEIVKSEIDARIADRTGELQASVRRLQTSEELTRLIVEASLDAAVMVDGQLMIVGWNRQAETTYGWSRQEAIGRPAMETIVPEFRRRKFGVELAHFIATGEGEALKRHVETVGLHRSGRTFPIEVVYVRLERSEGNMLHAFIRDISDRKRAEEALILRSRLAQMGADVGRAVTAHWSLNAALLECCQSVASNLGAGLVRIWLLNPGDARLKMEASAGEFAGLDDDREAELPAGLQVCSKSGEVMPRGSCPICEALHAQDREWAANEGMSFSGKPLLVNGRFVGALTVFSREPLTTAALQALELVADTVAVTIGRYEEQTAHGASDERLRLALRAGRMAHWHLDLRDRSFDRSDGFDALFGMEQGEFGGAFRDWFRLIHPEDQHVMRDAAQAAAAGIDLFTVEYRVFWPDGSIHWISTTGTDILDEEGNPVRVTGVNCDITDRKLAESCVAEAHAETLRAKEELQSANDQLEETLSNARYLIEAAAREIYEKDVLIRAIPSIMIGVDQYDLVTHWNDAAAEVFGISEESAIGKRFWASGIRWDWEAVNEAIKTCRATSKSVRLDDFRFVRPDSSNGVLIVAITPVPGGESDQMRLLVLGVDMTERRMLESQLAQGRRLEGIGQLAAGVAHEINTPTQYIGDNTRYVADAFRSVQSMLGKFNELLAACQAGDVPPDLVESVAKAYADKKLDFLVTEVPAAIEDTLDGVQRVTQIVQGMKQLSHPGGQEKSALNINRAIEGTVTVARNEWKYVAQMELDLDPDIPPVFCLPGEFNQVILNILINASHAVADAVQRRDDGEQGRIKVSTKLDGDFVDISIADSGTGIPEAVQPRIFDPFFTTKEVGKGTGQGLAIAHTIVVDKHGGSIRFETEEGKGTTFIIRLPIGAEQERKTDERAEQGDEEGAIAA